MKKKTLFILLFVCSMGFGAVACSKSHGNGDPDGGDTDSDTDSDTDAGDEWCPKLETSCEAPEELEICDVVKLGAPRLIFPLSGRHIRDRRPQIIWEEAAGATQYRLEIARDRQFTDVVYRSADNEPYPGYDDRLHHIVSCDLDCGVHFFRVKSVTSPECEWGAASYTWEMFVGMAPGDLDRDGVPDIAYFTFVESQGEMEPNLLQAWAFFNLDEQEDEAVATKVVEFEIAEKEIHPGPGSPSAFYPGDTNGDGYADLGFVYTYRETELDSSTAVTKAFFFSGLTANSVAGEEDAIRRLKSTVGERYFETGWGHAEVYRFSDVNGDGRPDLAFTRYDYEPDGVGEVSEVLVLLSEGESSIVENFKDNAIHIACPSCCVPGQEMLFHMFSADVNGDGFGDLWIGTEGKFHAYVHHLVVFGDSPFLDIDDPETSGLLISPSAASVYIGDWNLGFSITLGFPVGDFDDDGYLEVAGFNYARDHTVPIPVVTYGYSVIRDDLGTGVVTYDSAIDFTLVSGFPVMDSDNTERLNQIWGTGDLTGDGIDDLFVETDYPVGNDTPGRLFKVDGMTEWPELFDVADMMPSMILYGYTSYRTIADIDGDGVNETLFTHYTNGRKVVLSASGQEIDITNWVMQWDAYPPIY